MAVILVTEDQPEIRLSVCDTLHAAGHEVVAADTISSACEALGLRNFDLMVSDISLSDGSGRDLAQDVARAGLKILLMTGDPKQMISLEQDGVSYLGKPFAPETLLLQVDLLLKT
jgi:DNA-binding response OmpR family regulator